MIGTIFARQAVPPASSPRRPCGVCSFGLSDQGRVRPTNEDRWLIVELSRNQHVPPSGQLQSRDQRSNPWGYVFLVADGMGGHAAGEVASGLAVEAVEEFVEISSTSFARFQADEQATLKELEGAFLHAHARVVADAAKHPERWNMGTTLTMALAVGGKVFVAHAGHSRCYLLSGGKLRQLTQDHTMAAELLEVGVLSPKEAARHPYRHVVTNLLEGNRPSVWVELDTADLHPDDVLLLCSDGLTEMVAADRIAAILQKESEPRRACERLVAEANERGGHRNITVIVAYVEPEGCELHPPGP